MFRAGLGRNILKNVQHAWDTQTHIAAEGEMKKYGRAMCIAHQEETGAAFHGPARHL
jgi:hypothetical protein